MHSKAIIVETKHLYLRLLCSDDKDAVLTLHSDKDIIRYTNDRAFADTNDALDFIAQQQQKIPLARFAVVRKSDHAFVGWCGLQTNELDLVDLSFRFLKKYWGLGFATEAARACLQYGFKNIRLDQITARVHRQNSASRRVLEKIGMTWYKTDSCRGMPGFEYFRIQKH